MKILNYLYSTFDSDVNYNDEELNYLNPVVMIKYIYNKPIEFLLFGLVLFIIFLVDFIKVLTREYLLDTRSINYSVSTAFSLLTHRHSCTKAFTLSNSYSLFQRVLRLYYKKEERFGV